MNNLAQPKTRMSNVRWVVCTLLFFALTVNYLDRQVLSLTWQEFIAPEFHWTNTHYGLIAALFSLFYAASMLFAGRFIDWMGTKKGYMWAIGVWTLPTIHCVRLSFAASHCMVSSLLSAICHVISLI